jgi:hypothetical protein
MTPAEQAMHLATINRCCDVLREIDALGEDEHNEFTTARAVLAAQQAKDAADALSAYLECNEMLERMKQ